MREVGQGQVLFRREGPADDLWLIEMGDDSVQTHGRHDGLCFAALEQTLNVARELSLRVRAANLQLQAGENLQSRWAARKRSPQSAQH